MGPIRRVSLDFGWTYMDQKFNNPACMLVTNTVFGASVPAPTGCPPTTNQMSSPFQFNVLNVNGDTNVPVTQPEQKNPTPAYVRLTKKPMHRVALNLGYEITSTSGHDNWVRGDTGAPLQVLGDAFGN